MVFVLIILSILLFLIVGKNGTVKKEPKKNYYDAAKEQQKQKTALTTSERTNGVKVTISRNTNDKVMDNSIIEVGGVGKITPDYGLSSSVPYWSHSYVYSYNEIKYASVAQKKFYEFFKNEFLRGTYLDLEGNSNYAFILLFDLLNEFENHKNVPKLEAHLEQLGTHYPKTKSYGTTFLMEKMQSVGDTEGIARLKEDHYFYQSDVTYSTFEWRNKYKKKLNLQKAEISLMDKVWFSSNTFNSIEYCCVEIIKLYLEALLLLDQQYKEKGSTIKEQFDEVADVIVRKHFRYRKGSNNYKYAMESCDNEFYTSVFKLCENAVRESFGHKRKINVDPYASTAEAKALFELKILNEINTILALINIKIAVPDVATEVKLNQYNTTRWRKQFDTIAANYGTNSVAFAKGIIELGKLNAANPSVENIFFEASKFISKIDQTIALELYIHYLDCDMKSATFDHKQLSKTIQKSLFKNEEHLLGFQKIVTAFILDKDLEKALNSVASVYAVKRKKIKINTTAIKEVRAQHSGTVALLNEYLNDEADEVTDEVVTQPQYEEIELKMDYEKEINRYSIYIVEMPFKEIHTSTLELFSKSNFSMLQSEFETFAKSNGVFKNQLIESINEMCYEQLDGLLIEEDEEYYTINQHYYQKLLA